MSRQGNLVCGVRVDAYEAVTMVRVAGRPYAPTFLRGSTVSLTTNVLPLGVLTELLDQPGGLKLAGIDMVSSGQRVRRGTGYPPLYSTLLADRPAAGRRDTQLIVRLDLTESVPRPVVSQLDRRGRRGGHRTHHQRPSAATAFGPRRVSAAELDAALERAVGRAGRCAGTAHADEERCRRRPRATRVPALAGARAGGGGAALAQRCAAARRVPAAVGWRTVNARRGI